MTPKKVARLPGPVTPKQDVLDQVIKHNTRLRDAAAEKFGSGPGVYAIAQLWGAGETTELYRWKVRLDCGCITDTLTRGEDPKRLGAVTFPCWEWEKHPYHRLITRWRDREETLTEDYSAESDDDPELSQLLKPRPVARWTVDLECGHTAKEQSDRDFDPQVGPTRRTAEHIERKRQELLDAGLEANASIFRWFDQGAPNPRIDHDCHECRLHRPVVEYASIGWLVSRPRPAEPDRYRAAATVARLREALLAAERDLAEAEQAMKKTGPTP